MGDTATHHSHSAASATDSVTAEPLEGAKTVPLLIRPGAAGVDLEAWIKGNGAAVEAGLFKHGAILFRGFDVKSVEEFEKCARAISPELFGEYGDLPPEQSGTAIYQSTPYPPHKTILFHNEASHTPRWPMKQWFFCVEPAREGGETPIADCRRVYEALPARVVERFSQKGLMYVRNFTVGLDVSWQQFYKTEDRSVVERRCKEAGVDFSWKADGGLRTRHLCQAVAHHPRTGERVFFNQVQLHHLSCMPPALRESLLSLFDEEDLPRNVYYGDGTTIEDSVMEEVNRAYWQTCASFPWQTGDMLMLDNMLVAHARNPYSGRRKIVVAMSEMMDRRGINQ